MTEQKLSDLKAKSPADLLALAEDLEIEAAASMRKQELMFAILKELAEEGTEIIGNGVLEVLQDGFGFLRSADVNYLPGPDDIYLSPSQIKRLGRLIVGQDKNKVRSFVRGLCTGSQEQESEGRKPTPWIHVEAPR